MGVITAAAADGDVTSSLVESTLYFVETKFETELGRIGNWKYMTKWSGWVGENCFTEESNGSLSKCMFVPKPKMPVHQYADYCIQHIEEVYQ